MLLRELPDAIELLNKADWTGIGRASVNRQGQVNHLIIVPRARRQGLATEFWRGLSADARPSSLGLAEPAADASLWLHSLGWQRQPGGRYGPPSARPPELDFDAYQRQRARFWAEDLGISPACGEARGLAMMSEPETLELAGDDCFARPLYLVPEAASGWRRLRSAAAADGITLQAVSGFRSIDYQGRLLRKKLAAGATLEELLRVSAAPGYSEHHSGFALDLTTPDYPPLETEFAKSPAFAWLREQAGDWGFVMSYPEDNPHRLSYEPWHWRFDPE